jgi:hypothetical protein
MLRGSPEDRPLPPADVDERYVVQRRIGEEVFVVRFDETTTRAEVLNTFIGMLAPHRSTDYYGRVLQEITERIRAVFDEREETVPQYVWQD